jgi:cobalt-zinc-cadmium efflux system protein
MVHHHHNHPGAGHVAPGTSPLRALRIALLFTTTFLVIEFLGGLYTRSLALIADSGHMLVDSAALGLSLFALWCAGRPATASKTYGYHRAEILAALLNGVTLVVVSLGILYEAYHRLLNPQEVKSGWMLLIASMGLAVNLASAYFLHGSQSASLNVRGAFLHVAGDALSSVGAIVAGLLMAYKQWYLADPLASIVVASLILFNAWRLLRDSVNILLEATPAHIDLAVVREELCRVEGVDSIHDLHVWTLTSGFCAMSCHAVLSGSQGNHQTLERLGAIVRDRFHIEHSTIQLEERSLEHEEMGTCHSVVR